METGPDRINRYEIVEKLGEGGMATVYRASDGRLKREVAIKLIRTDVFGPALLEQLHLRFEREATALARMSHPNIVTVYDFGEHGGAPFIVMEYLPGGTLRKYMDEPVPYARAAALIKPIADALTYAHNKGIIHRDIKPANILFGETGAPKLSDFGIARLLGMEGSTQLTGTGMGVGTPAYMAPEQWRGEVSPSVDIYALGVVLYELLTGRQPYQATTPADLFLKMATRPPEDPRQYVPDLPLVVLDVLNSALAPEPVDRFPDMTAFSAALTSLVEHKAGAASSPVLDVPEKTALHPVGGGLPDSGMTMPTPTPPPPAGAQGKSSLSMDSGATLSAAPGSLKFTPPTGSPPQPRPVDTGATMNTPPPPLGTAQRTGPPADTSRPFSTSASSLQGQPPTGAGRMTATGAGSSRAGTVIPPAPPDVLQSPLPSPSLPRWIPFAAGGVILLVIILIILWPGGPLSALLAPSASPTPTLTIPPVVTDTAEPTTAPTATVTETSQPVATSTPALGIGSVQVSPLDGMVMAFIPAGSFTMGSANGDDDEKALPFVSLNAFWMDTTEVTNAMYAKCVAAGACLAPANTGSNTRALYFGDTQFDNYPVIYTDWSMAQSYCQWAGRRLPTEAEWEYAARGGLESKVYSWGDDTPVCTTGALNGAQFQPCDPDDTIAVASFAPNGYGLFDMIGNAWEWAADWYGPYPTGNVSNPVGPASGEHRIVRGGSWYHPEAILRVANRGANLPSSSILDYGFRCVVSP